MSDETLNQRCVWIVERIVEFDGMDTVCKVIGAFDSEAKAVAEIQRLNEREEADATSKIAKYQYGFTITYHYYGVGLQ